MTRFVQFAKLLVYMAATFVLAACGLAALSLRRAAMEAGNELQELHRATAVLGVTLSGIQRASTAQEQYFTQQMPVLTAQMHGGLVNLNGTLVSLRQTSDATRTNEDAISTQLVSTIQQTQPVLNNLDTATAKLSSLIDATQQAVISTNTLVSDPHIKDAAANLDHMTATSADTLTHIEKTAAHVETISSNLDQKVNSWVHPKWPAKVWNGVTSGLGIAARWVVK